RLPDHLARVSHRYRTLLVNKLREVATFNQLHCDVVVTVRISGVGCPHNVWVIEAPDNLHLALEPSHEARVDQRAVGEQLQSDPPFESEVPGSVDDAHATFPDLLNELVLPDLRELGGFLWLGGHHQEPRNTEVFLRVGAAFTHSHGRIDGCQTR